MYDDNYYVGTLTRGASFQLASCRKLASWKLTPRKVIEKETQS